MWPNRWPRWPTPGRSGWRWSTTAPFNVLADPDRLKQVLLNLVDNALRYTPPEGTVRLAAGLDAAAGTARIEVEDSGPGIAPADLPHIFDRFYRGDLSRARASGNTGLGLAIARGIIEAHGGTITVQSPPGGGACFIVLLPAARAGEPPGGAGGAGAERQPVGTCGSMSRPALSPCPEIPAVFHLGASRARSLSGEVSR